MGLLVKYKNFIYFLMCIELVFFSLGLGFVISSLNLLDVQSQIISLFILVVSVAESAVGLGLLVKVFKVRGNTELAKFVIVKY